MTPGPPAPARSDDLWWVVDIIVRRLPLLVAVMVVSVGIAVGLYMIWPRQYEAVALFEPGFLTATRVAKGESSTVSGEYVGGQRVEPSELLAAKLNGGAFTVALSEAMGIALTDLPVLTATIPRGGTLIEARMRSEDLVTAKQVLDRVLDLVRSDYAPQVNARTAQLAADIEGQRFQLLSIDAALYRLEEERTQVKKEIASLQSSVTRLNTELDRFRANTDRLLKSRETLVQSAAGGAPDPLSILIYDNSIQANLAQLALLQKTEADLVGILSESRTRLSEVNAESKNAEGQKASVRTLMTHMQQDLAVVSALHVVQAPWPNPRPVWPRLTIFGVNGAAAGALLCLLLVTSGEYRAFQRRRGTRPGSQPAA